MVSLTPVDFGQLTYMLDHHSFGGSCPIMGRSGAPYRTPFEGLWFIGAQSELAGGVSNVVLGGRKVFKAIRGQSR
jgi:hypothetical protein